MGMGLIQRTGVVIAMATAVAVTSCRTSSPRKTVEVLPSVEMHTSDSETVTIEMTTNFERDTLQFNIPSQKSERTAADSTSHLENDFAVSDAVINPDGSLTHTLATKEGTLLVPFDKPVQTNERTRERIREVEKPVQVPTPVEVERELSWWEQTRLTFGGWAMAAIAIIVGVRVVRILRRIRLPAKD